METKTIVSKQGTLQSRDWGKGVLIGAGTAILVALIEFVQRWIADGNNIFDLDWQTVIQAAVAGFITYLGKNLLEPGKIVTVQPLKEGKKVKGL